MKLTTTNRCAITALVAISVAAAGADTRRRTPGGYRSLLVALVALAVSLATTAQASGHLEVAGPEAVKTDVASTRLGLGGGDPMPGASNGRRHSLLAKFVSSANGGARVAEAGDDRLGRTKTRVDVVKIDEDENLGAKLAQYHGAMPPASSEGA